MFAPIRRSEASDESSPRYRGWRVVMAGFFGVLAGFGSLVFYGFSLFIKPLHAEFGWTRQDISIGFGCASLCIALFSPLAGRLLDRFGSRRVILPTALIFGIAFSSLAFLTSHLAQLYAVFVVLGVVGNASGQMGYTRAICTWFDGRRGQALALLMAGTAMGAIVTPVVAQAVITASGWRAAYFVLGMLSLLLGVPLTAVFVTERADGGHGAAVAPQAGNSLRNSLNKRAFWILACTLFLSALSVNGVVTHLSALLTDRGISAPDAALAVSCLGCAGLLGRLTTGYLLDRFFGPRVAFALLAIASAGLLLLSGVTSAPAVMTAAALIGFGMGGESDITPYLLTRYFGMRSFSSLYGFTWTAYAAATAAASVLMGTLFDATGSYQAAAVWLAVPTFAAGTMMLFMPPYHQYGCSKTSGKVQPFSGGSSSSEPQPIAPG